MKPQLFHVEQIKAAKRYVWTLYAYKEWFCGAVYLSDENEVVTGIEIRVDPAYPDRMTIIGEHEGVPISWVYWNPTKHGERYDARNLP